MFTLQGKHNKADVFAKQIDDTTYAQILSMLNNEAFAGMKIAIQADCHAGAGSVIGFTARMKDIVIPSLVGVDIGCGVLASEIGRGIDFMQEDLTRLDMFIHDNIPSGFKGHKDNSNLDLLTKDERSALQRIEGSLIADIDLNPFWSSVGTLGGGNHFIELDKDPETNRMWLVIHSGSRNFGLAVARWHQAKAAEKHPGTKDQEYLFITNGGRDYMRDMFGAQEYAKINRAVMSRIIQRFFDVPYVSDVESVHNYIDALDFTIRKGAISAHQGQEVVIPMNMAFGTVFGVGKGSEAHNYSAPHGAGRTMSRGAAKKARNEQQEVLGGHHDSHTAGRFPYPRELSDEGSDCMCIQ